MSFTSLPFILFFSIVVGATAITNAKILRNQLDANTLRKIRQVFLLIASYLFYAYWDIRFCILMFAMTSIAYFTSLMISRNRAVKLMKCIGVAVPLIVLGIFKYTGFFIESFYTVFHIKDGHTLRIILPVGISFYTFQALSYFIDVYRGKCAAEKDFIKIALYISFFPQLVAGPIVKAQEFLPQLSEDRNTNIKNIAEGFQMILFGVFKKVVIADHLSVFVTSVFDAPDAFHGLTVSLAVISYSIQIYFDFSGYSDIALGCAKCLGYDLPRNFNLPYISKNISEFWRRWHISLSTWLKEYLYFSLGGNRKGTLHTYLNLLITMLLGGLWHGANWKFVIWGGAHGIALCAHKAFSAFIKRSKSDHKTTKAEACINTILTYVFVSLIWIFFRADSFSDAIHVFGRLFVWNTGIIHIYSWSIIAILILAIATIVAYKHSHAIETTESVRGYYPILDLSKYTSLVIIIIVTGLIIGLAYTGSNPFIYFQF